MDPRADREGSRVLIEKGKALLAALGIGKKDKGKEKDKELTVGEPITFDTTDGADTLYIETTATGAVVMVASDKPMSVPEKLKSFEFAPRGNRQEGAAEGFI